ncbi:MAG: hypothetical protein Q9187_003542 [Circinaria calcarea]
MASRFRQTFEYRAPTSNSSQIPNSTTLSSALAYGVLATLLIYYLLNYLDYPILSIPEILWNFLVHITPSSFIQALDRQGNKGAQNEKAKTSIPSESQKFAAKSEAMRRILGLEGAGVLAKFQRPRVLSGISNALKVAENASLPGLGNWDNSCYQNSVLQGLASLSSFPSYLDQAISNPTEKSSRSTAQALKDLIEKLNNPSNVNQRFWTPAELKNMSSWQQQDAQEYFSKVLDEIEKEVSSTSKVEPQNLGLREVKDWNYEISGDDEKVTGSMGENSTRASNNNTITDFPFEKLPAELRMMLARNPLEGLLAQRVGCLQCGFVEGLSLIPFNCLTLPLGKQWEYDVRTCLDDYTSLEPINGVECSKCTLLLQKKQLEQLLNQLREQEGGKGLIKDLKTSEALRASTNIRLKAVAQALEDDDFSENTILKKCQIPPKCRVSSTKSRQAVIARPPKSLVLHVNRSLFDESSGIQRKNYADLKFPKDLDLSPWCLGAASQSIEQGAAIETWNTDPSSSMLLDPPLESNGNPSGLHRNIYSLRAVITHYGRHENGHYICYRRDPNTERLNDRNKANNTWWRLSDDDVSEVSEGNVLAQGGVFMLFYELKIESFVIGPARVENTSCAAVEVEKPTDSILSPSLNATNEASFLESMETSVPMNTKAPPTNLTPLPAPVSPSSSVSSLEESASCHDQEHDKMIPEVKAMSIADTDAMNEVPAGETSSLKENWKVTPRMRTAGPRNGRDSVSRAGKAMSSISSMVTAN